MDRQETPESTLRLVLGAAYVAAHAAVPDYVRTPRERRLARTALLAVALAGHAAVDAGREEPEEVPDPPVTTLTSEQKRQLAIGGGGLVLAAVGRGLVRRANLRVVTALRQRGVRRPHTWVGLGWAVGSTGLRLLQRQTPASRG